MTNTLSLFLRRLFFTAIASIHNKDEPVGTLDILLMIVRDTDSGVKKMFESFGIDLNALEDEIEQQRSHLFRHSRECEKEGSNPAFSEGIELALRVAQSASDDRAFHYNTLVLVGAFTVVGKECHARGVLASFGVSFDEVMEYIASTRVG